MKHLRFNFFILTFLSGTTVTLFQNWWVPNWRIIVLALLINEF